MEETGLERFLKEQEEDYPKALEEISMGKKQSCWMWYIFPQIQGLGFSETNKKYSIKDIEEAKAYLENETLKKRLIEITQALLDIEETDIHEVMGIDDCKLKSSMTLFKIVEEQYNIDCGKVFQKTLDKYFKGEDDQRTITILEKQKLEKQMSVKEKSSEEKEENNINKEKENEINNNDKEINSNTIVIEKSENENESQNENNKEEIKNESQNENNKEEIKNEIHNENNKEENNIESKIENNKEENNVTNIIINSKDNEIKSEKVEKEEKEEEKDKEEKKEIKENNIEIKENVIIEEKENNNSLNVINKEIKEIKIEKDDDSEKEKEKDKENEKDDDIINNNINNESDENGDLNSIKEEEKEEDSEEKKERSGIQIVEENKILTQEEQINTNLINNPSNNNIEPLGKKKSLHFSLPSRSQMKIMENNIKNNDDVEMIISDKKIENKSTIVLYPFEDDEKKKCCPECLIF